MNSPKNTISFYTVLMIALGIVFVIATVSLTVYYKNDLKDFVRKTAPAVPAESLTIEVRNTENQINIRKMLIDTEKQFIKMSGVAPNSPDKSDGINAKRLEKIEKLEGELTALEIKRDELKKMEQESIGKATGSFEEEYNLDVLTYIICFGIVSLCLAYTTFIDAMPRKNGARVNLERKAFLFFLTAVTNSAFGFALYLWYLSI